MSTTTSSPVICSPQLRMRTNHPSPDSICITVVGEVDLATTEALQAVLLDALSMPYPHRVEVDVAGVTFMDCSGLTVLIVAGKAAARAGCRLQILNPPPHVFRLLDVTGLLDILKPHATEQPLQTPAPAIGSVLHRRWRAAHPLLSRRSASLWTTDPTTVPGYQLQARIGRGGMSDVFSALPDAGGPLVAIKILRADGKEQSCRREFELASAVHRDITAAPIAYGHAEAGAYLVTSYLAGYRSVAVAPSPKTPITRLWEFGAALADVLATVHSDGVVHGDVKPSNLLMREKDLRLIDFGISRYVGEPGDDDGLVRCSPGWAAPEQLRNGPATPAIDVFAWGCVLAIVSTGIHPFAGSDHAEWILRVESALPDLAYLPAGMETIIRAALDREASARPAASELAALCFQRAQQTQRITPKPTRTSERQCPPTASIDGPRDDDTRPITDPFE